MVSSSPSRANHKLSVRTWTKESRLREIESQLNSTQHRLKYTWDQQYVRDHNGQVIAIKDEEIALLQ